MCDPTIDRDVRRSKDTTRLEERRGGFGAVGGIGVYQVTLITSLLYVYIYNIYITGENTTELRIGQIAWCRLMTCTIRKIPAPDTDTQKESSDRLK